MPDAGMEQSSTAQLANKLLAYLVEHADPDYLSVINSVFTGEEREWVISQVEARETENGLVGAVTGGTGIARTGAGLLGEEAQQAVKALKDAGRIMQCGRGRGKALVVLSSAPLDEGEATALPVSRPARTAGSTNGSRAGRATTDSDPSTDAPMSGSQASDIMRSIRDSYLAMETKVGALTDEVSQLRETNRQLSEALDDARSRLEVRANSWD